MTFFLEPSIAQEDMADPPKGGVGFGATVSAAATAEAIETDWWDRSYRKRREYARELARALPEEYRPEQPWRFNLNPFKSSSTVLEEWLEADVQSLMEGAQRYAADHPAEWGDRPLSVEQMDDVLRKNAQGELQEAYEVLSLGGGVANFVGRGGAAMTDKWSLALAPIAPAKGAGLGKTLLWGAGAGAAGEALVLSRMYEVADELDIPDPDPVTQVAFGAALGGALSGVGYAGMRGYQYLTGKQVRAGDPLPEGTDPLQAEVAAREAEEALRHDQPLPTPEGSNPVDDVVSKIIGVESAGNPNAKNPKSSAEGLGQFIDSTWLSMIQRYRPDIAEGRSRAEILDLKFDPALSREMTRRYTEQNAAALKDAGLPVTPGSLYLAHFAGEGGAKKVLRAADNAPIGAVLSPAQINANKNIRHNGKSFAKFTVADLRAWADAKMQGAPTPSFSGSGSAASVGTRRGYTRSDQVTTPTGRNIDVEYEVVDASLLRAASGDLQPRDRARASSDEQIAEIAARLDPQRLLPSPEADRGAPIVGPDNIIESGNGRVQAIRRAADLHPDRAEAYRQQIVAAGFDVPDGVQSPVLIARRKSDLPPADRQAFVQEANSSAIARMSATEQAQVDASAFDPGALSLYRADAGLHNPGNAPFRRAFLAGLPDNERKALTGRNGQLNLDGQRRMEQALFARAYGDPGLLEVIAETGARDMRQILDALVEAAPAWAQLRAAIEAGRVDPDFDATRFLSQAVRVVAKARKDAGSARANIDQDLKDADLFDGVPDPAVAGFVDILYKGATARNSADTADILTFYAVEAQTLADATGGLLGEAHSTGPREIIDAALRTQSIFTGDAPAAGRRYGPQGRGDPGQEIDSLRPDVDQSSLNLRTFDGQRFDDGAGSPAAVAAADQLEADLRADFNAEDFSARDTASLRDDIAADGDFEVNLPDGTTVRASEILDDLDDEAAAVEVIEMCRPKGGA